MLVSLITENPGSEGGGLLCDVLNGKLINQYR